MKNRGIILGLALSVLVFSGLYCSNAPGPEVSSGTQPLVQLTQSPSGDPESQEELKSQLLLQLIIHGLEQFHYDSPDIDDEFSEKVFDVYLNSLDYSKRFLNQEDVNMLKAYRDKLDDELKVFSLDFFKMSTDLIVKKEAKGKEFYQAILKKPFDFKKKEEIEVEAEKLAYAKDDKELKEYWRKNLKYQVLLRLSDLIKQQEKEEEPKSKKELEAEAREKVLKFYDDYYDRLEKLTWKDRFSMFMNAILNVYDPHTGYFPPEDKENFDISMSGQLEGIGARLQSRDGYIKVISIVPGSPSALQGELEVDDLIVKVAQGEEAPEDVVDMPLREAVKLIRGKKGTEVRLTVKKITGEFVVIPIIRDVVKLEETYAKSAVMKLGDGAMDYGYIRLPKFYTDFNGSGARTCAEDVKKEVEKLKEKNVAGIVLDLRNNGGGSLSDVVTMSGLFVEEGPVVQVKEKGAYPRVLKDKDDRVQYDGPLVILVNSFSASASEIIAAAMQDYDRAIVVGSASSFGKGTVQRFLDLDNLLNADYAEFKPLGAVKVTVQKFYRINGGATQLKGVEPDIVLPDNYALLEVGEKEQDYVMPWDEIDALEYEKWPSGITRAQLKANSLARVEQDSVFQLIRENAKRLKEQSDDTFYTLNLDQHETEMKELEEKAEKFKKLKNKKGDVQVSNLPEDWAKIEQDSSKVKLNESWVKALEEDVYIEEVLHILEDMSVSR